MILQKSDLGYLSPFLRNHSKIKFSGRKSLWTWRDRSSYVIRFIISCVWCKSTSKNGQISRKDKIKRSYCSHLQFFTPKWHSTFKFDWSSRHFAISTTRNWWHWHDWFWVIPSASKWFRMILNQSESSRSLWAATVNFISGSYCKLGYFRLEMTFSCFLECFIIFRSSMSC